MHIGIIGAGDVAKALATGFIKHGHDTMLGTRDSAKLQDWLADHPGCRCGSATEAAQFGDVVVLAVKGSIGLEALHAVGAKTIADKTVIDVTNPIADAPPTNGVLKYFTSLDESLMERYQRAFPEAHFVKAFNSVGNQFMVNPVFKEGKPSMFICGNHAPAKQTVSNILDQFGWEVEDMGSCEAARAIEPLCILWCIPGFLNNDWSHAFKLLR